MHISFQSSAGQHGQEARLSRLFFSIKSQHDKFGRDQITDWNMNNTNYAHDHDPMLHFEHPNEGRKREKGVTILCSISSPKFVWLWSFQRNSKAHLTQSPNCNPTIYAFEPSTIMKFHKFIFIKATNIL